jgi:hypothetical protein
MLSSRLVEQLSCRAVLVWAIDYFPIPRNKNYANQTNPRVFVSSIFEIKENVEMPLTKKDLIPLLKANVVVPFHKNVCPQCHTIPKSKEWATAPDTGKF